jgi:hypothetical protein
MAVNREPENFDSLSDVLQLPEEIMIRLTKAMVRYGFL